MPRGPRITNTVKELIAEETLKNPKKDRRLLSIDIQDKIARIGELEPAEETITKMISNYRNHPPDPSDTSWTLAYSVSAGLPVESTPALLKSSKFCLALEMSFTIREAKWASYLDTYIPNTADLVNWSKRYAMLERIHELLGEKFISLDLDTALTMSMFEYATISLLGKISPFPIRGGGIVVRPKSVTTFEEDAYEVVRLSEYNALATLRLKHSTYDIALRESDDDWDVLPPFKELDLSEDVVWIYTYWLSCITKGPKWQEIQRDQALNIMRELRDWINHLPKIKSEISKYLTELLNSKMDIRPEAVFLHEDLLPSHILEKVGYFATDSISDFPGDWQKLIDRIGHLRNKADQYSRKNRKANNLTTSKEDE